MAPGERAGVRYGRAPFAPVGACRARVSPLCGVFGPVGWERGTLECGTGVRFESARARMGERPVSARLLRETVPPLPQPCPDGLLLLLAVDAADSAAIRGGVTGELLDAADVACRAYRTHAWTCVPCGRREDELDARLGIR